MEQKHWPSRIHPQISSSWVNAKEEEEWQRRDWDTEEKEMRRGRRKGRKRRFVTITRGCRTHQWEHTWPTDVNEEAESISYKERGTKGGGRGGKGRKLLIYIWLPSWKWKWERALKARGTTWQNLMAFQHPQARLCKYFGDLFPTWRVGKSQERRGHGSQLLLGKLPKKLKV